MELKEFIKKTLVDVVSAVQESSKDLSREMHVAVPEEHHRAIEFDVAVSVEETASASGKGEIKVLGIVGAGGEMISERKNATASRIKFGVDISRYTKEEAEEAQNKVRNVMTRQLTRHKNLGQDL